MYLFILVVQYDTKVLMHLNFKLTDSLTNISKTINVISVLNVKIFFFLYFCLQNSKCLSYITNNNFKNKQK